MGPLTERAPIDFVVTWVDGGDPAWQAQRAAYAPGPGADDRPERYRDWGLLRYWFRGVEACAPWARQVHFVTDCPPPAWLDTAHPKLHVVSTADFMPPQCLPTFNSNALEVYLHRIPGLAEQFVYFNDDTYLLRPAAPEDFFRQGKPRDMLALQPVVANPASPVMSRILLNDSLVLCRHFDKRTNMRRHWRQYFHLGLPPRYFIYNLLELAFPLYTGFYTVHGPSPMLRSTYEELWAAEPEILEETGRHRFREGTDVTQYLFREWQKQKGDFTPANLHRDFAYLGLEHPEQAAREIRRRRRKMICANDTPAVRDFDAARRELQQAFESVFPQPSSFEKE